MQYITKDDHDSHDDVMQTAVFAAETSVTVDDRSFIVTMGGSVLDGYNGEAIYSCVNGF